MKHRRYTDRTSRSKTDTAANADKDKELIKIKELIRKRADKRFCKDR